MSESFSKTRIAKNSLFLYLRMLITMWFNLWATRLVLANLGVDNMGVYGVIGSVVGLFSILTSGITTAVQRYITFEVGKKEGNANEVFTSCLNVIFALSIFILIALELIGMWFLKNGINIPYEAQSAAVWVFQFSVLTCIVTLMSIPYNALIIAHEKLGAFAWISIVQVLLNWGVAYCLSYTAFEHRLLTYAFLLALISILIQMIYQIYCRLTFKESRYHWGVNKHLVKEIGKFTGISTTSNILNVITNQGLVLVINWTFGVGINAVYQIGLQLKNSIMSFGMNIFKAISPQITKTYANGEMDIHKKLVYSGSKAEMYMIFFIMVPFLFKTDYILYLWLGNVPEYTVQFCRSMVILSMVYAGFEPIRTAVMATNRIGRFLIAPEFFYFIASLLGSCLVAKLTNNPAIMVYFVVIMDILTCLYRIYLARNVSFIRIVDLGKNVCLPSFCVFVVSCISCYLLTKVLCDNISQLLILLLLNSLVQSFIIYYVGLNKLERQIAKGFILKAILLFKGGTNRTI